MYITETHTFMLWNNFSRFLSKAVSIEIWSETDLMKLDRQISGASSAKMDIINIKNNKY